MNNNSNANRGRHKVPRPHGIHHHQGRRPRPSRGSRKGYNADVEEMSLSFEGESSSAEESNIDNQTNSSQQGPFNMEEVDCESEGLSMSSLTSMDANNENSSATMADDPQILKLNGGIKFYASLRTPKRQKKKRSLRTSGRKSKSRRASHIHPDIDLSLVSLLSSKEHDRRQLRQVESAMENGIIPVAQGFRHRRGSLSNSSSHFTSSTSSSSGGFSSLSRSSSLVESGTDTGDKIYSENSESKNIIFPAKKSALLSPPRPLAVIDYGSIQFGALDMTGSLLDSIYKVEPGIAARGSTVRGLFGLPNLKRRSSIIGSNTKNDVQKKNSTEEKSPNTPSLSRDKGCVATLKPEPRTSFKSSIRSCRSPDVAAVIASLKKEPEAQCLSNQYVTKAASSNKCFSSKGCSKRKDLTGNAHHDDASNLYPLKKQKLEDRSSKKKKSRLLSVEKKLPTTLEDAISFSPFARVLFDAHPPHTIVHTNAAYSELVNKGLVGPCIVGEPLAIGQNLPDKRADQISKIVASHLGVFNSSSESDNSDGTSSLTKRVCNKSTTNTLLSSYHLHIFPVVCDDRESKDFVRLYRKHEASGSAQLYKSKEDHQVFAQNNLFGNDAVEVNNQTSFPHEMYCRPMTLNSLQQGVLKRHSRRISHYLLQIEPNAQILKQQPTTGR